jgi:hypothetical protein
MSRATYTTHQFLEAIPGTGGIVTAIARKVGCAWATARKFIDTHPTVASAYQDECESILDLAEAKTISAIKDGDTQMIRYYLSTKGKRRGYSEKVETEQRIVVEWAYGDDPAKGDAPEATRETARDRGQPGQAQGDRGGASRGQDDVGGEDGV